MFISGFGPQTFQKGKHFFVRLYDNCARKKKRITVIKSLKIAFYKYLDIMNNHI